MICAIHQPNFFPWLGYFDKIVRTDVFVFLNQVDYEKSGHSMQSYTNRVAVMDGGGNKVNIHCPVVREHGPQPIDTVRIKPDTGWKDELTVKLYDYYSQSQYFQEVKELLEGIFSYETDFLSEFNIHTIETISEKLGIQTRFIRQDELDTVHHSTKLLAEIAESVGCVQYMYGGGGSKYQEDEYFEEKGIVAVSQDYRQPEYMQGNSKEFVGGLSIIDSLFWNGISGTAKLLFDGLR